MDTRTNSLVVGLYLIGAAVIGGLGMYAYGRAFSNSIPSAAAVEERDADSSGRIGAIKVGTPAIAALDPIVQDAHASLAVTRKALEKRTQALNQKNAECLKLKAERDETFVMLMSLLNEHSQIGNPTAEQVKDAKTRLDSELEQLKEAITKSELLDVAQEQRIAELEGLAMEAELELTQQQEQAKRDVDAAMLEKEASELMTAELIGRVSDAAVPVLVELLGDERPSTRRWAARMLGAMGSPARDASIALRDLFTDPDSSVRSEAQRAFELVTAPN